MRPKTLSWLTGSEAIGDNQKSRASHIPASSVNGSGSRSFAPAFHQRPESQISTTSARNFRHSMASHIPFAMRKLKIHSNSRPRASSRATIASMASTSTTCFDESAYRIHFDSQSSEFNPASPASRPVSRWSSSTEGGTISPKKAGHRKSKTNSIFSRRPGSPTSIASSHRTSVSRNSISVLGRHKKRKSNLEEVSEFDPTTFRTHRMRPKVSGLTGHEALYQEYDDLFDDTLDVLEDIPDEELVPEMSQSELEHSSESRKGSEAGSFFFLCGNDLRSDQVSPSLRKSTSLSPLRTEFSEQDNQEEARKNGCFDSFSQARESLRSFQETGTATPPYSKPGSYSESYSSAAITTTGKMALPSPPTPPPKIDGDEIVPPRLVEALAAHEPANKYGNIKRNSEMRVISLTSPASQEALDSCRSTETSAHLESSLSLTSIYEDEVPLASAPPQSHSHPIDTTTNTTSQQAPNSLCINNIPPPIPTPATLQYTQLISTPTSILNCHQSAQHSDQGQTTPELEKDEGDSFGRHTPEEEEIEHKMRSDTVTSCLFEEIDGGVASLFFSKTTMNKKPLKIDSSVGGGRTVGIPNSAPLIRSAAIRSSSGPTRRTISGVDNFNIHELESQPSKFIAPTNPRSPTADNASVKSPTEPRMVSSVYDFSDLGFIPACEPWTPQSPEAKKNIDCLATIMVEEKQVVEDEDKSCSDCESCASEVLDSMKEVVARPMTEIFNPSAWQYYDFNFSSPEGLEAANADAESIEAKVETPEEKEAAKKERDLSYLRAFRLFLKRSPAADAYIQRNVRFEAMQTQRYRAHVRSLPVNPTGKATKGDPKPLSTADVQHQVRDDIMGSLWALMAYRWMNFGKIIISPAHELLLAASYKRLNRRVREKKDKRASELLGGAKLVQPVDPSAGRRRVLDLGGEPVADWGWHCAYDYPRAKVYTVTLRTPKAGDEESSSSESDTAEGSAKADAKREEDTPRGPPNHRHVSVKCFWSLPFPSNHFDVISVRTLYASLTNNCHTSSHSGRFIDEYDLVMEEIMRVLKPGGYFEYNLVDCEIINGSSSSREFAGTLAMNLADKNHDPFPGRRFISRLRKAGFKNEDIKRSWIFAPLAATTPKPKPLPKDDIVSPISAPKSQLPGLPDLVMEEIKADMAKKMGQWEEEKAVPSGCTDAVASISGLIGGWALERMARRVGMNGLEVATALGEVVRDEVEGGNRAGLKTLVGWARKPSL